MAYAYDLLVRVTLSIAYTLTTCKGLVSSFDMSHHACSNDARLM